MNQIRLDLNFLDLASGLGRLGSARVGSGRKGSARVGKGRRHFPKPKLRRKLKTLGTQDDQQCGRGVKLITAHTFCIHVPIIVDKRSGRGMVASRTDLEEQQPSSHTWGPRSDPCLRDWTSSCRAKYFLTRVRSQVGLVGLTLQICISVEGSCL